MATATQPVFTQSGGSIIPQGGAPGTPVPGYIQPAPTPAPIGNWGGQAATPAPSAGMITRTGSTTTPPPPTPTPPPPTPAPTQTQGNVKASNASGTDVFGNPVNTNVDAWGNPIAPAAPTGTQGTPTPPPPADASRAGQIQAQTNTAQTDPTQTPAYQQAYTQYQTAEQAYNALKLQITNYDANAEASTDDPRTISGREGIKAAQLAGQLDAYATTMQQAQAAMNTAVTGYQAQTNAQNAATTQTQPSNQYTQVAPANTLYGANGQPVGSSTGTGSTISPLTGQPFTSTGNPKIDSVVSAALQQIASGSGYSNALSATSLNSYGPSAIAALQSGLPSGFNTTASDAEAAAKAKNIGTQTTTPIDTASQGYQASQQAYISASTAYTTAQLQASNVQDILTKSGINSANSQDWNNAINNLSGRLGSSNQTAYITGLNEMKQSYTNLLASVGASTPTVNGQQATDIFNPGSTPKQIQAAIDALNNAAYAKLAPMYQQFQTYQSQLNGGGGSSGGSTASTSVGNFKLVNGQWVAA
jgi:hypothetical protein